MNTLIAKLVKSKKVQLTEIESKQILVKEGIPVIESRLAGSRTQAIQFAREMGLPVVLKIVSPDIIHKSDAGGVRLDLNSLKQVGEAYREIIDAARTKFPKAKVEGISVQKMARPGIEVIIGMSKDSQFGPVIMFGLGGILVELLKDVAFRVAPVSRKDALDMIEQTKGYKILQGFRGQEPADIQALADIIVKLSKFAEKNPLVRELDLNPVFAYKDGAVAVDARITLETK